MLASHDKHRSCGIRSLGPWRSVFLHGCPSQDDLFAVPLNDFLVWYQARITRPVRSGQEIESLSDMIRLDKESECASYLDRDHMTIDTHLSSNVLAKHLCQEKGATMIEDNTGHNEPMEDDTLTEMKLSRSMCWKVKITLRTSRGLIM